MAEVLVIGANGFIGSHLVDALAHAGHSVTAFDRYGSGSKAFAAEDVRILRGDFLNRADLDRAVEGAEFVFHFLSTTSPATAEGDPTLDVRTNVAQSIELLDASARAGVAHFYYASTGGAIYGPQGKTIYREEDRTEPVSPYAIGKLSIENYLRYFDVMHGLSSTALRISNPYGTRQPEHRRQGLIPIALRHIVDGEPVVKYGDGSMVRDYLYVQDLVRMIVAMVGRRHEHSVYNLGSGIGHSVNDVIESLRRVTGTDFAVVERPTPATFIDRVVLDTSRYTEEFGVAEITALDRGIDETFREMRAQNDH